MQKIRLNSVLLLLLIGGLFSCKGEKKVYESTTDNKSKKVKQSKVAVTRYNKLLKSDDSEAKFNAAIAYFEKKDYGKALELLEDIISVYRGTAKASEVQYYYAFTNYNLADYIVAAYQFRSFVKNYPDHKHTELCAYMAAMCYFHQSPVYSLDQGDTETAVREFQNFVDRFPQSQYVSECNQKLDELRQKLERKSYESAMLYFHMENYKSAIVAFENHLKDFPGSKHVEELGYMTIKAYYLLAKNSIETKKRERFMAAINSYVKFAGKFPGSTYLKAAEKIYLESLNHIDKL